MAQKNVHSYRPTSCFGYTCLFLSYLPPLIALCIVLLVVIPYIRTYCYYVLYMHQQQVLAFVFGSIGMIGTALILTSHWKCLATPAGFVDVTVWSDPPMTVTNNAAGSSHTHTPVTVGRSSSRNPNVVTQLGRNGELRRCQICSIYKPDDAHHCHDCGRCVERMDHHCPWINNCVGLQTEKYFLLFLLHIAWTGCFMAGSIVYGMYHLITEVDAVSSVVVVLVGIGAGVFGSVLLCFGGFHAFMLFRGITTIDFVISRRTGGSLQSGVSAAMVSQKRKQVLDAVFGVERPWWTFLLPTTPIRSSSRFNYDSVV